MFLFTFQNASEQNTDNGNIFAELRLKYLHFVSL